MQTAMDAPERLKDARIKAGYDTAKAAAEAIGIPVPTYLAHENGSRGYPPRKASRYARFFRTTPEWLLYGRGTSDPVVIEPRAQVLPLLGQVRAGAWLSVDESRVQPSPKAVALDGRFPHATQWLREVVGDSMDAKGISEGDLVHLVDWAEAGIPLATGQIVEVTRHRDAGELCEVTLKEVEVKGPGHILLWPRSTNSRHKDAILMTGGDDSGIETQVTGLLVASIRSF